jgi:hypothetical protein
MLVHQRTCNGGKSTKKKTKHVRVEEREGTRRSTWAGRIYDYCVLKLRNRETFEAQEILEEPDD